jgi:predicted alpha/beta-fold hydrolase
VSIGGNIVCKYVGELGANLHPKIRRAVAISPPLDLRSSAQVLAQPSRTLYMRYLLQPLRERMREKARRFPEHIDISGLSSIRSFHQFDARYTAPLHGFQSVDHYWDSCSGLHYLPFVTIPTHIISALDDPFLSPSCFPKELAESSAFIHLETPQHGGHVGFIESLSMGRTWLEQRVLEYLSWTAREGANA